MAYPLVSVLVTVYNRSEYVGAAIESVLGSTLADFELLVVDDASDDESLRIARQYERSDTRVSVHANEQNLGQFANRNLAATFAKGEFIKYLDSDDVLYPHSLQVYVDSLQRFPDAAAAISHDEQHEDRPYPIVLEPTESYRAFFLTRGFPNSGPSAAIVRRSAFETVGGFPRPFYVGTDTTFWLKLAALFPIVKVQPGLIWYRRHSGQAIVEGRRDWSYLGEGYRQLSDYLNSRECPLSAETRHCAHAELQRRTIRSLIRQIVLRRAPLRGLETWKQSGLQLSALKNVFLPQSRRHD